MTHMESSWWFVALLGHLLLRYSWEVDGYNSDGCIGHLPVADHVA